MCVRVRREQEKQRGYLVEALSRRGAALCRLQKLSRPPPDAAPLLANLNDLLKFSDLTDAKVRHSPPPPAPCDSLRHAYPFLGPRRRSTTAYGTTSR